jgi:hypothetical protein
MLVASFSSIRTFSKGIDTVTKRIDDLRSSNRLPVALWLPAFSADVIAIRAGRLVDPERGSAGANQIILVEGGRFSQIGANVESPWGRQKLVIEPC